MLFSIITNFSIFFQSHCINYGVSDPSEKRWSSVAECHELHNLEVQGEVEMFPDEDSIYHKDNCDFCDGVVTLFKILTGILERMEVYMPQAKYQQALYNLRRSENHVNVFKGYQIRTAITREAWSSSKKKYSASKAFLTYDFPMNYFLEQNRGTTRGWFGKVI